MHANKFAHNLKEYEKTEKRRRRTEIRTAMGEMHKSFGAIREQLYSHDMSSRLQLSKSR